jgi:hypothetical protein
MKVIQFEEFDLLKIGNEYEISGVVYSGNNHNLIIMLPGEVIQSNPDVIYPILEEYQKVIRQSDLKEVELVGEDKNKKIILRKSTRQIDQKIMWEVFRRDEFICRYCGTDKAPMTVDHMVLWEEGGPSIPMNLLTSCKKCNNTRSNMQYEDWLISPEYISRSVMLTEVQTIANQRIANNIPLIKEKHMRQHKRSR